MPEEDQELREGQELYEVTQMSGFKVLKDKLETLAFHSWVDPRTCKSKDEWMWQEENAFHAANNAIELLDWIQKTISRSEYLDKKQKGEITVERMKI